MAQGNTIEGNDATSNGLLNIEPTLRFDLFELLPVDNIWRNNQGIANFSTQSTLSQSVMAEALGADPCALPR